MQEGKQGFRSERMSSVDLVRAVLGNLHESLKWLWLIVMGLAVVNAIEVYAALLQPQSVTNPLTLFQMFISERSLVFVSFILVFVRFYFGDSRFLDLSYEETHYSRGLSSELGKYSGSKRFADIMLLLSHGIFFYFMSFYIGASSFYIYFFIVLMLVNVFWLLIQVALGINARRTDDDPLIGNLKGYQPMLIWSINNLAFVFVIMTFMFSQAAPNTTIALGLTILNSIVDLAATWRYYFPPLQSIYEAHERSANSA